MDGTPHFVVVTGLPASGKSTLARGLGKALGLRVFDKDDFLEARFGGLSVPAEERHTMSRAADDDLQAAVEAASCGVVVSFWRRPELSSKSGTPAQWLVALPGVVEVWCVCDPVVARDRFVRRRRHPGHGDDRMDLSEVLETFERLAALGPLGIGAVVEVRTDRPVDLDDVVARVRSL